MMSAFNGVQLLTLPGWQNSGPAHWQTLWETHLGAQRVEQHDWQQPLRGDWISRLEEVVLEIMLQKTERNAVYLKCSEAKSPAESTSAPIVLIAHSLGCHLVAAWAALSRQTNGVRAAFLVAPPDLGRPNAPAALHSWRAPTSLQRLPFPSLLAASNNDPFASLEASQTLAKAWGARFVDLGSLGHVNAASNLGLWPQGQALLQELLSSLPSTPALGHPA